MAKTSKAIRNCNNSTMPHRHSVTWLPKKLIRYAFTAPERSTILSKVRVSLYALRVPHKLHKSSKMIGNHRLLGYHSSYRIPKSQSPQSSKLSKKKQRLLLQRQWKVINKSNKIAWKNKLLSGRRSSKGDLISSKTWVNLILPVKIVIRSCS